MPVPNNHPHGTTVYAPPVTFRAPSPASSIGTQYDDDATPENERIMGPHEYQRLCEERIRLHYPRPQEDRAMQDPLVKDRARGSGGEAENALVDRIMNNLRAEIKCLEEEEIYERAMLKGSQIGLECQAPTSDVDKIMRSMMSPTFTVSLDTAERDEEPEPASPPPTQPNTQTSMTPDPKAKSRPAVTSGPWNNYGKKPTSLSTSHFPRATPRNCSGGATLARLASAASLDNNHAPATSNALTNPKQTSDMGITATAEDRLDMFNVDKGGHAPFLSPGSPRGLNFGSGWPAGAASSTPMAASSQNSVIGGKRTRSGMARR